ncbi:MAG: hypothetical protein MPN21_01240 [Thermoanaerobaculia bacterium]|nr:hypothetical protein [Thermoanaerobaculia bacterium]
MLIVAVLLLPVLWWTKVAFLDEGTEMLPPSSCGSWVVHPEWGIVFEPKEHYPPVLYRLDLPAETIREPPAVEITALGSIRVRVGERACGEFGEARGNWRRPVHIDLADCVGSDDTGGESRPLVVGVRNDDGPAPVRVCWPESGGSLPATGEDGWSSLTPGRGWLPAGVAGRETSELRDKTFTWPAGPWGYRVLLAGSALLVLVGLWRGRAARSGVQDRENRPDGEVLVWLVLALVVSVYCWNALQYPWWASRIDQGAHAERLREAAEGDWLPEADRSFQSYQPPLYYALAGGLVALRHPGVDLTQSRDGRDLRPAQVLDAFAGTVHLLLAFLLLRRHGPSSPRARALSLGLVGLAPVAVTTYPMLGNETLAASLCGAALLSGVLWLHQERMVWPLLAGFFSASALLSKYTGVMPTAALAVMLVGLLLMGRGRGPNPAMRIRTVLRNAAVWLGVIALVAGPFYVGRWLRWGDPFIGNWDRSLGFGFEGEPGYRTLGFFTRFGEVFFYSPERAMWSSFWDGLYASTWGEINDSFLPAGDPAVNALLLLLMAFAVVPTLAGLAGFAISVRRAWSRGPGLDLVFVAVSTFTLGSVAVYTTQVPFVATVKALFMLSLLLPVTFFVARGYAWIERGLGRACWLLDVAAALQLLLVLRLFVWVG